MSDLTPEELRHGAVRVVERLRKAGYEGWLVGGCVRDFLLNKPIKDYDIATNATPDQVMALFRRTVAVGAQFGVVMVLAHGGEYEVGTFRAEGSYSDGRRPDAIRFVNAREDVVRRDFTINGLLQDPSNGEICDFVNGQEDLEAGLIRAIGDPDERFAEDHLRMLRAIRFASTIGFDIHVATFSAMVARADKVALVSVERITKELSRSFSEGDAARAYTLLCLSGILAAAVPKLADHKTAGAVFQILERCSLPEALAAMMRGEDGDAGRKLAIRLKLAKYEREELAWLLDALPRFGEERSRPGDIRFIREPRWPSGSRLARAIWRSEDRDLAELDRLDTLHATLTEAEKHPPRLVDGRVLKSLGIPPGRRFKDLLDAVEDAQLEGRVTTVDQAKALVATLENDGENA